MKKLKHIAVAAVLLCTGAVSFAGPRGIGGTFSPASSGISYVHNLNGDIFYELSVEADYAANVFRHQGSPGAKARFSYNCILLEREFAESCLRLYGGAGAMLGYLTECFRSTRGVCGGLTGTFGAELAFRMPVSLTLDISPCLGFMLHRSPQGINMDFYVDGVTYALLPRIGIRYCF